MTDLQIIYFKNKLYLKIPQYFCVETQIGNVIFVSFYWTITIETFYLNVANIIMAL